MYMYIYIYIYIDGKCLTKEVVYQATVTKQDGGQETYVGLTELTFKTRYTGHMSNARNQPQRNATTLSSHLWDLKDKDTPYTITWKVLAQAKAYAPGNKRCNLCLKEKFFIIYKPEMSTLNSRNELVSACRHRRKFLLCTN